MASNPSSLNIQVRVATANDIPHLEAVEKSAAQIFLTDPTLAHHASGPTVNPKVLQAAQEANHLWVAYIKSSSSADQHLAKDELNNADIPIGYLAGEPKDASFFIIEVSVEQKWQSHGVGGKLIEYVCQAAKNEGFESVSLTTYRDVSWNGAWYGKRGFEKVDVSVLGRKHEEVLEKEREHGMVMDRRCCMIRWL